MEQNNTPRFKTLEENEIALLKERNLILQEHLTYLRSLVRSKELKLKRNDELLKIYVDALAEKHDTKVKVKLEAFSLN